WLEEEPEEKEEEKEDEAMELSASRDLLEGNDEVCIPGPMPCDLRSVHRGVKRLSKQMHDRYKTEKKMERILRQEELRRNGQAFDIIALDSARVGPFPARRLAWRRVSHCSSNHHSSSDFTSDSSSSSSSSDSSSDISSGLSFNSLSNSSSVHSSGCDALDHLARDEDPILLCGEEHMEIGTAEAEAVANLGISDGVGAHTEDGIVDLLVTGGISKPNGGDAPDLEGTLYDIAHYTSKVTLGRITEFETTQRQLEAGQLVASEERELEEFHQARRDHDDTRRSLWRTIGTDAAFAMSWKELMKLIAEVYCARTEIHKMESEL
nr:hypothetical protein [Tanacetum cinerariifolium]